jgi:hypothetical protein
MGLTLSTAVDLVAVEIGKVLETLWSAPFERRFMCGVRSSQIARE